MENYPYKTGALYHEQGLARQAQQALLDAGFAREQVRLLGPTDLAADHERVEHKLEPESDAVANTIIKDTVIGTGIGGAAGAAGATVLAAAEMALFLTTPVLGALMLTAYGATIGGTVGALTGVKIKETAFLSVMRDALKRGYWGVVVHARDEAEAERAGAVFAETDSVKEVNN